MGNKREPIWWLPLLRRILGWGLAMMFVWGCFAFLFIIVPVGVEIRLNLQGDAFDDDRIAAAIATSFPLLAACFVIIGGAIVGLLAGFYAPTTEPKNPFRSPFFVTVGKSTFVSWLLTSGGLAFTICALLFYFNIGFSNSYISTLLLFLILMFALSLWRALNHALLTAKTANSRP